MCLANDDLQYGLALFNLPWLSEANYTMQTLQQSHNYSSQAFHDTPDKVRDRGGQACPDLGVAMKLIARFAQSCIQALLFEPPDSGLPAGLLTSPTLVLVIRGTAYIPIVVGSTNVLLYPPY